MEHKDKRHNASRSFHSFLKTAVSEAGVACTPVVHSFCLDSSGMGAMWKLKDLYVYWSFDLCFYEDNVRKLRQCFNTYRTS